MTGPTKVAHTTAAPATRTPGLERSLRELAAWGLAGARPLTPVPGADEGSALVALAGQERLSGVLSVAADAGAIELHPDVVAQAHEAHRSALVWCLRLEIQLLHLVELLRSRGVEPVVLKGPAAAHLDDVDASLRPFGDLDLLVAGADVDRAVAAIVADGAARPWAERRPGFDRRFAKSVTLRYPNGLEVDLHRTLVDGVHGVRIPLAQLHEASARLELGGASLPCLSLVHRVLHTAYHLALGSPTPRLMSLRDLAGHLTDPVLHHAEVVAEARRWGGEAVLAHAVRTTVVTLGIEAPHWEAWADGVHAGHREQAVLERQRREGSALGRAKLDVLRELPWRDRPAYAAALVAPSRDHLRSRGLRRRDLVRR